MSNLRKHKKYWLFFFTVLKFHPNRYAYVCNIDGHRLHLRACIKSTKKKSDLKRLLLLRRTMSFSFQYFVWAIAWMRVCCVCVSAYACVTFNNHIRQLLHSNIIYIFILNADRSKRLINFFPPLSIEMCFVLIYFMCLLIFFSAHSSPMIDCWTSDKHLVLP